MKLEDYASYDGLGLAELVRLRDVTPAELLDCAIAAIEELNPTLNAVTIKMFDEARSEIERGLADGPFKGVPFLLKDVLADYRGVPTTYGTHLREHSVPTEDSELVRRYRAAGLVIAGKTAVPELVMSWGMASRRYGATRNPWNLARNPGVSSGGTAAAVTSRMVPMAHGNDGGGSIRVPASCTGTFGLKPTRGRNPLGPKIGDAWMGMVAEHALTRTVRDSAALLDATAGPYAGTFYNAPYQAGPFLDEVGKDPGHLRMVWSTQAPYGAACHPDCEAAVDQAVALCLELGHTVEEKTPPLPEDGWSAFETFLLCEYAADVVPDEISLGRELGPEDFPGVAWDLVQEGREVKAVDYLRAVSTLHRIARMHSVFFQGYDILITPTLAVPPVTHEHFDMTKLDIPGYWRAYLDYMPYTHQFNVSGQPAMSVPLHWSADGLPIGVQFAARVGEEATLFRLASQLEAAQPWDQRRPPHCVGV